MRKSRLKKSHCKRGHPRTPDNVNNGGACITCRNDWERKRYQENSDKTRTRELKRRYGITLNKYEEMLTAQNNVCAICNKPCPTGKRLAVDHDWTCCSEKNHVENVLEPCSAV